ncbi:HlyC/CorC family transporter [Chelatococcus reniformis]|uniref:Membrane protein n=1 Tax=Chelatococcus reniformis TaxID=1494448 RepID=A0A916XJR6_9HYPH|nr:HlyC/CorC family transporter [Chelatococcus reniformis]GGC78893.1 membrane protein [Chelatococcus reniformis]
MADIDLTPELWIAVGIVALCLLMSAFFSGSETALTAASRARMHALEMGGDARAAIVNRLLSIKERLIGAMLIGNNIVNIGASAFTTSVLVALFGDAGVIYATVGMSVLVIIFAEIMPKTVAIKSPERAALLLARPVSFFVALFGPVTLAIEWFVRVVLRPFGLRLAENQAVLSASEELRGQVDLFHREGGVVKDTRDMLGGLLDLGDLEVSDLMVHRTKMRTLNADLPPVQLVREVLASPHTRLPVWRGTPENIIGVVHAKDLLRALYAAGGDAARLEIAAVASEPWFVPDTNPVEDQLKAFLARKNHFALVVDEYGEVMGLVTLEDILEEIVGDIRDEHDLAVQGVRPQPDGAVFIEGSVPIRDLNRAMDWHLPDEEATTIAGLVIHEAQTIPEPGQAFTFHGFRFQVMRRARNRITLLRVTRLMARQA